MRHCLHRSTGTWRIRRTPVKRPTRSTHTKYDARHDRLNNKRLNSLKLTVMWLLWTIRLLLNWNWCWRKFPSHKPRGRWSLAANSRAPALAWLILIFVHEGRLKWKDSIEILKLESDHSVSLTCRNHSMTIPILALLSASHQLKVFQFQFHWKIYAISSPPVNIIFGHCAILSGFFWINRPLVSVYLWDVVEIAEF